MAESACLRRSLSHPSSAFRHPPEGDPIRCLTESVSFGRFVSESLAWERWSAFSHNRYLEEVQQISKAGSVAEKKAFFEAHYKSRASMKDAAKLEQANVNAGNDTEPSSLEVNPMFPDAVRSVSLDIDQNDHVHLEDQMQVDNAEAGSDPEPGTSSRTCCVSLAGLQSMETVNVMVPDAEIGNSAVEPSINLEDQVRVGHAESSETDKVATPKERTVHEGAGKKKNVPLRASKRLMNPSSRIPSSHRDLKLPRASVKQETFSSTKAGDPSGGSTSAGFISKKNSGSKALHMSISFSSCQGEKIRISPRNSTVNMSVFGRNITSRILKTVTEDCSRSSIGNGSKPKAPTVSSPFRFRSEERAAKRREETKLEERCCASEAETIRLEGKQQCKISKTQQSTNSGSRLEDDAPHHESKPPTRTTRMSAVSPQPPKSGRKPFSSASADERTLDSAALLKRKLMSFSVTSSPQRKRGHEKAPPNMQR